MSQTLVTNILCVNVVPIRRIGGFGVSSNPKNQYSGSRSTSPRSGPVRLSMDDFATPMQSYSGTVGTKVDDIRAEKLTMFHVARLIAALGLIRSPSASCFSCPAEAIATKLYEQPFCHWCCSIKSSRDCCHQQYPRLWCFMSGWFGLQVWHTTIVTNPRLKEHLFVAAVMQCCGCCQKHLPGISIAI